MFKALEQRRIESINSLQYVEPERLLFSQGYITAVSDLINIDVEDV